MILEWVVFGIAALGLALLGFGLILHAAALLLRLIVTPCLKTQEAKASYKRGCSDCNADGSIFIAMGAVLLIVFGLGWLAL